MTLPPEVFTHSASLVVYVISILICALGIYDWVKFQRKLSILRGVTITALILCFLTSLSFITAQGLWLHNSSWNSIDTAEEISWLFYDWFNGLTHLLFAQGIRSLIQWKAIHYQTLPMPETGDINIDERRCDSISCDIEKIERRLELISRLREEGSNVRT